MALNVEKIAKLPASQKLLALAALVVLIVFLYYIVWDKDYQSQINRLNSQLSDLKTEISKIRAIAADITRVERELALLEKKLSEALTKLPNEAEVEKLLITIDELGRENGLTFSVFKPGTEANKQLYTEVPISLKFTGNFYHVLRFFDEITKLPRIITISDLTMSQVRSGKTSILDVSCVATTYKFREESATVEAPKGRRR
jgi:type IV pilus assembly protein PilO